MKIGVISHLFPGKRMPMSGIYVQEEIDSLARLVDIRLLAPLPNQQWFGENHRDMALSGYPVVRPFVLAFPRWFLQGLYPASMALSLKNTGRHFFSGCGCIHVHTAFPDGVAAVKAFGGLFPLVATVHGSDINHFAMKPNLRPGIVDALNRMECVICVSGALERTVKELGVSVKTTVIPNGVDTGLFKPGEKEHACSELNLDVNRPRILFAGNFVPVKGVEYLIKAMPHVLSLYPDCELVLLGAGPGTGDRTRYEHLILEAGVYHAVRIEERVSKKILPAWIRSSDVVAVPSIREGFGLIAAEALACGRPVVATRSGGPEDIVGEGEGILVPPRNPEALGEALARVFDVSSGFHSPEEMAESVRKRFSYETIARNIVSVYESACDMPVTG
ncbi:glycosyltransferase [bacterium]|nr:glycosyltransferase [bacterium]